MSDQFVKQCSSSGTPFYLKIGNRRDVKFFEISGCDELPCVLTERIFANITIRLKMREFLEITLSNQYFINFICNMFTAQAEDNPIMRYKITNAISGVIETFGSGFMPIPCGSLVNSTCPMEKDQIITYSAPFQVENYSKVYSVIGDNLHSYLTIEMYGRNGDVQIETPMFRFILRIVLQFCYLGIACNGVPRMPLIS